MEQVILKCDVPFLPVKQLKTGGITCYYEAGNLRYIKWGNTELVRMIYSAVRDENWNTLPITISNEKISEKEDGFKITYDAVYASGNMHYIAGIEIEAHNNHISFSMQGEARSSFKKNRIGLCILHPLNYIERPVQIVHPDRSITTGEFPRLISPHQPFTRIREMQWSTDAGITTTIAFDGDIFETEDQRNWTDASFKTYSTPLDLPFPALVNNGDKMRQVVSLSATLAAEEISIGDTTIREERIRFPAIGFSRNSGSAELTQAEVLLFNQIPFDHYGVSLRLFEEGWKEELSLAVTEASRLNTTIALSCSLHDDFDTQLAALMIFLKDVHHFISSVLLVDFKTGRTTATLSEYGYQQLKTNFPLLNIGYGTAGNFADLNRNRPQGGAYDFLSFSLYPQAHATDNRTIIENLESQWHNISTMKSFANGKRLHVSPVSLSNRNSLIADERQFTAFAAFWYLMCLQGLAEADSITFYSLAGKSGLVDENGKLSPFYELLKKIKAFHPAWIIRKFKDGRLLTDGLVIENVSGEKLLIKMDGIP